MGTRAFSHDSIFIPDGQAEDGEEVQATSQDFNVGKVKSLQQQLSKNINFGQPPPANITVKRMQELSARTEKMEETLSSPMEIVGEQEIGALSDINRQVTGSPRSHNTWNVAKPEHKLEEKVTPVKSSRPKRPSGTIESINLDAVPRSIARLDNSAAKHKLSVKPKNQRVSKKHRGMSQDYLSMEDNPYELAWNMQRSPDKAMYHSSQASMQDIFMSDHTERKHDGKKKEEQKQPQYDYEHSKQLDVQRKSEADKGKEEAERKRQEIIRNIELERLQQKIRDQKENEMKEQRRKDEERKQRAEQILKELEEHRRQDELRQQELEQQRVLQLAEEQKKHELEQQRVVQIEEEQKRQELEKQKAIQEAEVQKKLELEQQKAFQIVVELKKLEQQKALQIQEQKKNDTEEKRALQAVEDLRSNEKQVTLPIVEEQKKHMKDKQNIYEREETGVQEHNKETLQSYDHKQAAIQQKCSLELKETLLKNGEQTNELVKKKEHPTLDTGAVSTANDPLETQKMKEAVKEDEEELGQRQAESQKQERINEELRWQELDQKQRPFTFKVTSGEKQIIFEKVNLSPVTPLKEAAANHDIQDSKENKASISSHALTSSHCVPHTAILVTGAQLCGTAVNLSQIKDTACKSLLGLNEERKIDIVETKNEGEKDNNKSISSKTKFTSESLDNQSVLAEWASIRSKILSKVENISITEKNRRDPIITNDDWTSKGESHSSLRKTLSASAKFSITPAWQKFPETIKSTDIHGETSVKQITKDILSTMLIDDTLQGKPAESTILDQEMVTNKTKKQVTVEDNTEGWIFSKDLPSFLVPNPPQSPRRQLDGQIGVDTQMNNGTRKTEKFLQNPEEKNSPFGVKLRRTNYSLRFHSDPQNEQKRKKRYSAGDSFDGIPTTFIAAEETDMRTISRKEMTGSPVKKENLNKVLVDNAKNSSDSSYCAVSPVIHGSSPFLSSPNKDKLVPKSPTTQKPSLAPKPPSPTPPPSPLSKLSRTNVITQQEKQLEKYEQDKELLGEDTKLNAALSCTNLYESLERDVSDKTCFPPVTLREKVDKRLERIGKDRPILQSRHSLDGTRLVEKVESAQPLWITLALQKQKGFRDQQASREERRQAREAKQADRLARDHTSSIQLGEYRSRSGSLPKPIPHEEKKCDTVVTRLQRREQLQKSNTLPTSVTVEITETVPVSYAKDLPKRFSTPDATTVTSEPAWLALAKRKSKAWSDCPQIIK